MSADFSPGMLHVSEPPQPQAHIWIGPDGAIVSVICTNVPDGMTLPEDSPWCLLFEPEWQVTVTDLGARR